MRDPRPAGGWDSSPFDYEIACRFARMETASGLADHPVHKFMPRPSGAPAAGDRSDTSPPMA